MLKDVNRVKTLQMANKALANIKDNPQLFREKPRYTVMSPINSNRDLEDLNSQL